MAVIYVFFGLVILVLNAGAIPGAIGLIFKSAFSSQAAWGGVTGITIRTAISNTAWSLALGNLGDIVVTLCIPNLFSLIIFSRIIAGDTRKYIDVQKKACPG